MTRWLRSALSKRACCSSSSIRGWSRWYASAVQPSQAARPTPALPQPLRRSVAQKAMAKRPLLPATLASAAFAFSRRLACSLINTTPSAKRCIRHARSRDLWFVHRLALRLRALICTQCSAHPDVIAGLSSADGLPQERCRRRAQIEARRSRHLAASRLRARACSDGRVCKGRVGGRAIGPIRRGGSAHAAD